MTVHPVGVIHGRFQVVHNDHLKYLLAGAQRCRRLIVGVTNPDPRLTKPDASDIHRSDPINNPLTYFERQELLTAVLTGAGIARQRLTIVPLPINYPQLIKHYVPPKAVYFLTIYDDWGRAKKLRLEELGLATEKKKKKHPEDKGVNGTEVRRLMVQDGDWQSLVPFACAELMKQWDIPARLKRLSAS